MRKNIIAGVAVSVLLMAVACKKSYLAETPYSSYSPSTLTDSLGFEAASYGLYNQLSTFFTYSGPQGWPSVWQVGTDVAFATQPQGIEVPYYNYQTLISTDGAALYTWQWAYAEINNANIIIANIESPTLKGISAADRASTDAEARFFRAYSYNVLAECFGGVPLVVQPLTGPKTNFVRASLDSV